VSASVLSLFFYFLFHMLWALNYNENHFFEKKKSIRMLTYCVLLKNLIEKQTSSTTNQNQIA
jgi:hypothetical protein